MQLAAIMPAGAARAAAPGPTRPPAAPAAPGQPRDPRIEGAPQTVPAAEFNRKHALDYLAMPGVYTVGWGSKDFDEFYVNTKTEAEAAQLAGMLERQVGDIKVVLRYGADRTPWQGTPSDNATGLIRGIAAMPGVWLVDQRGVNARGGRILVRTINQDTIDRLNPLLKDRIFFGNDRAGRDLFVAITWRAGIPS